MLNIGRAANAIDLLGLQPLEFCDCGKTAR
jgi:hypothetical protein